MNLMGYFQWSSKLGEGKKSQQYRNTRGINLIKNGKVFSRVNTEINDTVWCKKYLTPLRFFCLICFEEKQSKTAFIIQLAG